MSEQRSDSLWIVTAPDPVGDRPAVVERGFGANMAKDVVASVDMSALRVSMRTFLDHVQEMVETDSARPGQFELSQVEFTAQVTATGKVCLLGSGGSVQAAGGIKFVLKRKVAEHE